MTPVNVNPRYGELIRFLTAHAFSGERDLAEQLEADGWIEIPRASVETETA